MKNRKNWEKRLAVLMMSAMVMSMMCVSAFAAETTTPTIDTAGITTAFVNGFNSMVTTSINMISSMVPIALTLAGVLFLIRKAMSWFKGMAK